MLRTIKGRLTASVTVIVVAGILLTTAGITAIAGKRMIHDQTQALQLNADKYAAEIDTWIETEKMIADGAADSIAAGKKTDTELIQSVVNAHAEGRSEILNLYFGTNDIRSITSLIGEIAAFMERVETSAEHSSENASAALKQMEELFRLSTLLNQTVASFRV